MVYLVKCDYVTVVISYKYKILAVARRLPPANDL